jgi:hypothetical protein
LKWQHGHTKTDSDDDLKKKKQKPMYYLKALVPDGVTSLKNR